MSKDPKQTRGYRDNNPLDVEDFGIKWQGIVGTDGPYLKFDTALNGIRAGAIDIMHAQTLHHRNTVRAIISAYAPPEENDTEAYITHVAMHLGVNDDASLDLKNRCQLRKFVEGCMVQEIGGVPYDRALLEQAVDAAIAHG